LEPGLVRNWPRRSKLVPKAFPVTHSASPGNETSPAGRCLFEQTRSGEHMKRASVSLLGTFCLLSSILSAVAIAAFQEVPGNDESKQESVSDIRTEVGRLIAIASDQRQLDQAADKIKNLGPAALDILLELLPNRPQSYTCQLLLAKLRDVALPKLIAAVRSGRNPQNWAAAEALALIEDRSKYPPLFDALRSSDLDLAYASLVAISNSRWRYDDWTPDRLEAVVQLSRSDSEYTASKAADLVVRVGDLSAIVQLRPSLSDPTSPLLEEYKARDLLRLLRGFPHAEALPLYETLDRAKPVDFLFSDAKPDASYLGARMDLSTELEPVEILKILDEYQSVRPFEAPELAESLRALVKGHGSLPVTERLSSIIDNKLRDSFDSPAADVRLLATLSPARSRSAAIEVNARRNRGFPRTEPPVDLLVQLEEPEAVPLLVARIKDDKSPEEWSVPAQMLGKLLRTETPQAISSKLTSFGVPKLALAAVLLARQKDNEPSSSPIRQFPLGVPLDYAMLSVEALPNPHADPDFFLLRRDRLVSSNVLVRFAEKNPRALMRALSNRRATDDWLMRSDSIWALTKIRTTEATSRLREMLRDRNSRLANLHRAMIIDELGTRHDAKSAPLLLESLASQSDTVCASAARAVGNMQLREASAPLRRELRRPDRRFSRRDLAEALVRIEGDAVALELITEAKDWSSGARQYLFYPLARSGSAGEKLVIQSFENAIPQGPDAYCAADALLSSGRPSAALGFLEAMNAGKKSFEGIKGFAILQHLLPLVSVRFHAPEFVEPLAQLAVEDRFSSGVLNGLEREPGEFGDQVIARAVHRGLGLPGLVDYVTRRPTIKIPSQDWKSAYLAATEKLWALRIWLRTGSPEAIEALRERLAASESRPNSFMITELIEAVCGAPNQEGWEVLPDLIARLPDTERIRAFGSIPRAKSHPALVQTLVTFLDRVPFETERSIALKEGKLDIAGAAAAALERLDAEEAIPSILANWQNPGVRVNGAMLMARHPRPDTTSKLMEMVRKRDYPVWRRIEIALAVAAAPDPSQLVAFLGDPDVEVRRKLAAVFGRIPHKATDEGLLRLAEDDNGFVRSEAIAAMDRGPAKVFEKAIIRALDDKDAKVRREAVRVCGALRLDSAGPHLRPMIQQSGNSLLKEEAARAVGSIGGREAQKTLMDAISGNNPSKAAIRQIGRLRVEAAVPQLDRLVHGENIEVRQAALQALGRIGTEQAVSVSLDSYLGFRAWADAYLQRRWKAAQEAETKKPQEASTEPSKPPDSTETPKTPELHWPEPKDAFTTEHLLAIPGAPAFHYSYEQSGDKSRIAWSRFERVGEDETWPVFLSESADGEKSWSAPTTLLTSKSEISHLQLITTREGQRLVLAHGRRLYVGAWGTDGRYTEQPIPIAAGESQAVQFNVMRSRDGRFLLFVAIGIPIPDSSDREAYLVVLSSPDLVDWSAPSRIAPISEGLGYFTVEAIPAAEFPDGSILVGVGRKLYHSTQFPDSWETIWDGEANVTGWVNGASCLLVARDGTVHFGYRSDRYGYDDLYLVSTTDLKNWIKPQFTTIHDALGSATTSEQGSQYLLEESDGRISVLHYSGGEPDPETGRAAGSIFRSTPDLRALARDTDEDGLTDAIEQRLLTDPRKADSDDDGVPDSKDLNPLAPRRPANEKDIIRQTALERLNYWHEHKRDPSKPAPLLIVVTDGEERQEFTGYPGIILNLSAPERRNYWNRFGRFALWTEEVIITDYQEGPSEAKIHTFTGHEAFSMTLNKLAGEWVVTNVIPTFRVY
jgi:HEAT repeat protein